MLSFETCNTDDKTVKSVKLYSPVLTASKQQWHQHSRNTPTPVMNHYSPKSSISFVASTQ